MESVLGLQITLGLEQVADEPNALRYCVPLSSCARESTLALISCTFAMALEPSLTLFVQSPGSWRVSCVQQQSCKHTPSVVRCQARDDDNGQQRHGHECHGAKGRMVAGR